MKKVSFPTIFGPIDSRSIHEIEAERRVAAAEVRDQKLAHKSFTTGFLSSEPTRKQRKTLKQAIENLFPKYVYAGDNVKFSPTRSLFNHAKPINAALNYRYLTTADWKGNTKLAVLDCDCDIPDDFDWEGDEPEYAVENPINGHLHLYFYAGKTNFGLKSYRQHVKRLVNRLNDKGLKVSPEPLLKARSPLFAAGKRRKATELREGRDYTEADFHVTTIFNLAPSQSFIEKAGSLTVPSYKTEKRTPPSAKRRTHHTPSPDIEVGHRHTFMVDTARSELIAFRRKYGAITVEDAFDIYKKFSSDLPDSQVWADATCSANWLNNKYTGDTLGHGDWFNGMYLNVELKDMREIGWNNFRENVGETKQDCSKRLGIPYWKVKDLIKKGLMQFIDGFYDHVQNITDRASEYISSITTVSSNMVYSTNSGDGQKGDVSEMDEVKALFADFDHVHVEIKPPTPPPKDISSFNGRQLAALWDL